MKCLRDLDDEVCAALTVGSDPARGPHRMNLDAAHRTGFVSDLRDRRGVPEKAERVDLLVGDLLYVHQPVAELARILPRCPERGQAVRRQVPGERHRVDDPGNVAKRKRRRLPGEAADRKVAYVGRIDPAPAEALDEGDPVAALVVRDEVESAVMSARR